MAICYGLIAWFAQQTIKELKSQKFVLTERTKNLQRQFSRIMLIQAVTQIFPSFVPLAVVVASMFFHLSTGYVGELIMMGNSWKILIKIIIICLGYTWFPVINSLSNVIFIKVSNF